jgi:nicotinamide riboside kinase
VRIAITGAHGVGKSTLAARLSTALGLPELPTPGRMLAAKGLPINDAATVTSQAVAWLLQYRLERERSKWVASRSLIDVWAYTSQAATRHQADPVELALMSELSHVTPLAIRDAYDELIYVAPRIPLVADDARSADAAFQASIDEAIRGALSDWGVDHIELDVRDQAAVEELVGRLSESAA